MKKFFLMGFVLIMILGGVSCTAQSAKKQETKAVASNKVEVYYFHFTRRCVTCNAVESESKKAIEALYPELIKSGKLSFIGINLDEESSKPAAEKYGVGGQSLLVISGHNRIDLTPQGFMYARSNPEKLKSELKTAIDPLVK